MKTWLHYEENEKSFQKVLLCFLLLFLGYGFYKNGLSYFLLGKMSLIDTMKPLLFPLMGILESMIFFFCQGKKDPYKILLLGLMIGILPPSSFPIWIDAIYTAIFLGIWFLTRKNSYLPMLLFYKLGLMILGSFFQIDLQNIVEQSAPYYYGTIDVFLGRGLGGYGTTSIFLVLFLYFFLCSQFYYKNTLPLSALVGYSLCFFGLFFLYPDTYHLQDYFNPSFFFAAILFLPKNSSSPATRISMFLYGFWFGILSFLLIHLGGFLEGAYYALAISYGIFFLCHFGYQMYWQHKRKQNVKL